jgi:hypothetical protein
MNPYRPRLDTSSVVICLAICQNWEARSTIVHDSWSVAHDATETRKGSVAVIWHRSEGRGQAGDMEVGDVVIELKSVMNALPPQLRLTDGKTYMQMSSSQILKCQQRAWLQIV